MNTLPKKISLSRKGFDSGYGKMPSPIMPDGTLLSLPIPSKNDYENNYGNLFYNDCSYYDIIHSLSPNSKIKENYYCHLDPDIRREAKVRLQGWKPAFGQRYAALSVLDNNDMSVGDLFLFFGWFRQTEYIDGRLAYMRRAPDVHIIFGYLQVGNIIRNEKEVAEWISNHPHSKQEYWKNRNAIYVASDILSFNENLPGAGVLDYDEKRVLTMPGKSRTIWKLPSFFKNIDITYHPNPWFGEEFHSAKKGQEFVFSVNDNIFEWVKNVIGQKNKQ